MSLSRPVKVENSLYSIYDISEVARKALKSIINKKKAPIPPVYEEEFYSQAEALGLGELVDSLLSKMPSGQVAQVMVAGLKNLVIELDGDLEKYGENLDRHSLAIKEGQGKLVKADGHLLENVRVTLDDILKANMEMMVQLKETRERLKSRDEQIERLKKKTRIDPLTGALNRGAMEEDLQLEFSRSKRYNRPFSVIMADIDFFKRVNDTYGHATGDHVLRSFARLLRKQIREVDVLYRYGGEEFLILLRETDLTGASIAAERMRSTVEGHVLKGKKDPSLKIKITASFGVAHWQKGDANYNKIIDRADKALYAAKQSGRNQVVSME